MIISGHFAKTKNMGRRKKGSIISIIVTGENAKCGKCELCGHPNQDLRPYGPKGENICFDCGMLDEEGTDKKIKDFLNRKNE
jgi:hypothetical protein